MVCRLARAASTWLMLCWTAERASLNCWVISANERVNPPSSSLPCKAALGVRSPLATWRTPSARTRSGLASWLPSTTASSTAPNTARNRLSVRVPMYILRRPPRASARSWYSRLASCTAMALATSVAGMICVTCKNRTSPNKPTLGLLTTAIALMRADMCMPAAAGMPLASSPVPVSTSSSSPSICVTTRCTRALRSCWEAGRSGLRVKRDAPTLATIWPEADHSTTSLAES